MSRGPCGSRSSIAPRPPISSAACRSPRAPTKGVVDPYQRAFGYPGLHVMDGSVMPANPGVNPSLMITGLAERAMSFWPNKGDADPRPALGSGYNRLKPVMPHKPMVPAGAPARAAARRQEGERHSALSVLTALRIACIFSILDRSIYDQMRLRVRHPTASSDGQQ